MGERLFPDFYDEEPIGQNALLSTIRVPKNLLYLTDRLPKPSYSKDGTSQSAPRGFPKGIKSDSIERNERKRTEDDRQIDRQMPEIKKKNP